MRLDPRRRPFLSIALAGFGCALAVALAGRMAEWYRLGETDVATYAKVEEQVRRQFEEMSEALVAGAARLAAAGAPVLRASPDERDLRPLFEEAAAVARGDANGLAATVYGADETPLAWSGRPSETERWPAKSALFVAPGPLGLRLLRTLPITDGGTRLGTVVVERLFAEQQPGGALPGRRFTVQTPITSVGLRTPVEGAGEGRAPFRFLIESPAGDPLVEATVDPDALARARARHRQVVHGLVLGIAALTVLLLAGPLLDRRALDRTARGQALATLAVAGLLVVARALLWAATPVSLAGDGPSASRWLLLSPELYSPDPPGFWSRHALDFLLTALLALALAALGARPLERWRLRWRGRRRPVAGSAWLFAASQSVQGAVLAAAGLGYEWFLADAFRSAGVDLLYFSPLPWNSARVAIALALVLFNAAFAWAVVLALRAGLAPWRFRWLDPRVGLLLLVAWGVPVAVVWGGAIAHGLSQEGGAVVCGALGAAAFLAPRGLARLRHASQGYRLTATFVALFLPAVLVYPSMVHYENVARQRTVEDLFDREVMNQRENLLRRLLAAQQEIDGRPELLESLVSVPSPPPEASIPTENAFVIWQDTALERYRVSSAVELYNAAGRLVSRFALNLPEEANRELWHEESCEWQTFGLVSRFGAKERQLLHAGRNVCGPKGVHGTIVLHVILDDSTLSFLSTQNPYFELLRGEPDPREDALGRDLQYVVYGWSRTPIYVSGGEAAWVLDDELFERVYASRSRFWMRLEERGATYEVLIGNDRRAIYALGYPSVPPIQHFINLAELMVLAGLGYAALLAGSSLLTALGLRRPTSARHLLREIRESFYRKLFLAFVAASVIPVVTLALVTRAYIADQLRDDVEAAAHKTTAIARQVIEESLAAQDTAGILRDDFMVTLEVVVGQDVNIYAGPDLVATSERDLFASGLLPTRTPADVYRAIVLERMPTVITEEQAGTFRYMVAAAPVRVGWQEAMLTVPLTLRQQEIERQIRDLNRRIVLAAMLFILVGAAFGYPLAERIADPVNRLMGATRRLSRGDFDVHIATSASDELRRLVEAFNRMSSELQRQRVELERTHRLEAWAEMARQVAHEIKNPLTPIQLSAEHLQRVHRDRGRPLEPVLEGCVESILSQVRLLRQIASEFSSFASSPTPRRGPTALSDLVEEVVRPYQAGAGERVAFEVSVPDSLPVLSLDRTLVGRALTNVIDNSLHAMPGGGTLRIEGREADGAVVLEVADTGVGMDEEALRRLFEPYFSTKAIGTGLGLSIARRNIELNAGTIAVTSEKGRGTRVTIRFPVTEPRMENAEGRV